MTFDVVVARTLQRLKLTANDAETVARVQDEVNEVYKSVWVDLGMEPITRTTVEGTTTADSRFVTFGSDMADDPNNTTKIMSVHNPEFTPPSDILGEMTYEEMLLLPPSAWPPRYYSIYRYGAHSVTIFLDGPADDIHTLQAKAYQQTPTLTTDDEPGFPENFHDMLIDGTMAIELESMEKGDRYKAALGRYMTKMAALRFHIIKSAWIDIYQGRFRRNIPLNNSFPAA